MLLIRTLTMQGTISSPLCKQTATQCKTRKCKLSERHDGYSFIFLLAKQERTKKKARSTDQKKRKNQRWRDKREGKGKGNRSNRRRSELAKGRSASAG